MATLKLRLTLIGMLAHCVVCVLGLLLGLAMDYAAFIAGSPNHGVERLKDGGWMAALLTFLFLGALLYFIREMRHLLRQRKSGSDV